MNWARNRSCAAAAVLAVAVQAASVSAARNSVPKAMVPEGTVSVAGANEADGQALFDAGRFADALEIWAPLAQAGDPQAQLDIGALFDTGEGVPMDQAAAFRWYLRAAEAGLPAAQFNVAVLLDTGQGVPRDRAEAALWYARAAARGYGRAAYNLAQLYAAGDGVPKNADAARAWYRAAAADGLPAAASKLANLPPARSPNAEVALAGAATSPAFVAPKPVWPPADATINAPADPATVTLIWDATPEPRPVTYEVRLLRIEASGMRPVFSRDVQQTALMVRLDEVPGFYVWTVTPQSARSARPGPNAYSWFKVEPSGRAVSQERQGAPVGTAGLAAAHPG